METIFYPLSPQNIFGKHTLQAKLAISNKATSPFCPNLQISCKPFHQATWTALIEQSYFKGLLVMKR